MKSKPQNYIRGLQINSSEPIKVISLIDNILKKEMKPSFDFYHRNQNFILQNKYLMPRVALSVARIPEAVTR